MTVNELRLCLEPFHGTQEVRVHVSSLDDLESYGSRILFVGKAPFPVMGQAVVYLEVDSDKEYDL